MAETNQAPVIIAAVDQTSLIFIDMPSNSEKAFIAEMEATLLQVPVFPALQKKAAQKRLNGFTASAKKIVQALTACQ